MIHYNRIEALFARLAAQPSMKDKRIKLKVSDMKPIRRPVDGEIQDTPPKIGNGEIVEVIETDVDAVRVRNDKGVEVVFAHTNGALKLECVNEQDLLRELIALEKPQEKKEEKK